MKTIIEMAREAGFEEIKSHKWTGYTNHLKSLIELVRADEREAAEERVTDLFCEMETPYLPDICFAIRARGNT